MGFLDGHLTEMAERIMEHIDLEEVTKEVLSKLTIKNLDLYFVVYKLHDMAEYTFLGMAYSERAAKLLWLENNKKYPCKIVHFDMGKLVTLVEKLGGTEEVT